MTEPTGRWLRFPREPSGARRLVVCFPPTGAHGATFASWAGLLPAKTALALVDPPGRGARLAEPPVHDMTAYTAGVATEVARQAARSRPPELVLLGVSLGGLIAYETCRALVDGGCQVDLLCPVVSPPPDSCHGRGRTVTPAEARAFADEAGLTPPELVAHPEFAQLLLPPIADDLRLRDAYDGRSAPALPVPVRACWASHDPRADPRTVEGWARFTTAHSSFPRLTGGHYVHQSDPAQVIRACLD